MIRHRYLLARVPHALEAVPSAENPVGRSLSVDVPADLDDRNCRF